MSTDQLALLRFGLVLAASSFLLSAVFCAILRRMAPRWGLLDRPGGHKGHAAPTPLGGGVAIWLAIMIVLGASGRYPYVYDLGEVWKRWTDLPFVFAVWVARRDIDVARALGVHAGLIQSRNWGVAHRSVLARQAHEATGVSVEKCDEYLAGLDYGLSYPHLAGLTEFFRRLVKRGRVPNGTLSFLTAA